MRIAAIAESPRPKRSTSWAYGRTTALGSSAAGPAARPNGRGTAGREPPECASKWTGFYDIQNVQAGGVGAARAARPTGRGTAGREPPECASKWTGFDDIQNVQTDDGPQVERGVFQLASACYRCPRRRGRDGLRSARS